MKALRRFVALFGGGLMVASIVGAVAARAVKRRTLPIEDPDADEVRISAILGPMYFRSAATSFRGGTVDCWYGGGAIDLRDAVLDPAGSALQVRAVFGGGQIVVPESWRITSRVRGIGGLRDGRPESERPADAPHLTIEGIAIFGGFAVTSELSEDERRGLEAALVRMAPEQPAGASA